MRTYHVPFGRIPDYKHPAPDRTAYRAGRGIFDEYVFRVWPSRGAMLEAVRMSEKSAGPLYWKALSDSRWFSGPPRAD